MSLDEDRPLVNAINLDFPSQVARKRTLYPPSLVNAKGACIYVYSDSKVRMDCLKRLNVFLIRILRNFAKSDKKK